MVITDTGTVVRKIRLESQRAGAAVAVCGGARCAFGVTAVRARGGFFLIRSQCRHTFTTATRCDADIAALCMVGLAPCVLSARRIMFLCCNIDGYRCICPDRLVSR